MSLKFTFKNINRVASSNVIRQIIPIYSSRVFLARPSTSSSLKITDRSFRYASPCLWNQVPLSLHQPHSGNSSSISYSLIPSPITSSSSDSPLWSSITPSLFHSQHKTYLFHNHCSFTSSSWTAFMDYCPDRFFWATRFMFFVFLIFHFCAMHYIRLAISSAFEHTEIYCIISYRTPLFSASVGSDPTGFSLRSLASVNYIPWAIVCSRHRKFSHLGRTPTCDGQTDGQTVRWTMMTAYTMLA